MTRSHRELLVFAMGPYPESAAALLTKMSTPPNAAMVSSTRRFHSFSSDISAESEIHRRPVFSISARVWSSASRPRAAIAMSAPFSASVIAIARPIPLEPPVTIATLSLTEKLTFIRLDSPASDFVSHHVDCLLEVAEFSSQECTSYERQVLP